MASIVGIRTLGRRRWDRRAWICCRLDWKGIRRQVMGPTSYTELFFLDEATALAAGHRPCNDCRREDLLLFCSAVGRAWGSVGGGRPRTQAVDDALHAERLDPGGTKRWFQAPLGDLPDGAMYSLPSAPGSAWLRWRGRALRWSSAGYEVDEAPAPEAEVMVLTPPTTLAALGAGYRPQVHPTAG